MDDSLGQIAKLEQERDALVAQIDDLGAELEELNKVRDNLQARIDTLRHTHMEYEARIVALLREAVKQRGGKP